MSIYLIRFNDEDSRLLRLEAIEVHDLGVQAALAFAHDRLNEDRDLDQSAVACNVSLATPADLEELGLSSPESAQG